MRKIVLGFMVIFMMVLSTGVVTAGSDWKPVKDFETKEEHKVNVTSPDFQESSAFTELTDSSEETGTVIVNRSRIEKLSVDALMDDVQTRELNRSEDITREELNRTEGLIRDVRSDRLNTPAEVLNVTLEIADMNFEKAQVLWDLESRWLEYTDYDEDWTDILADRIEFSPKVLDSEDKYKNETHNLTLDDSDLSNSTKFNLSQKNSKGDWVDISDNDIKELYVNTTGPSGVEAQAESDKVNTDITLNTSEKYSDDLRDSVLNSVPSYTNLSLELTATGNSTTKSYSNLTVDWDGDEDASNNVAVDASSINATDTNAWYRTTQYSYSEELTVDGLNYSGSGYTVRYKNSTMTNFEQLQVGDKFKDVTLNVTLEYAGGLKDEYHYSNTDVNSVEYGNVSGTDYVFSGTGGHKVVAYNYETGSVDWVHSEHSDYLKSLEFAEINGTNVLFSGTDNEFIAYNVDTQSVIWNKTDSLWVSSISFGWDGTDNVVFVANNSGSEVDVYDFDTQNIIYDFEGSFTDVNDIEFRNIDGTSHVYLCDVYDVFNYYSTSIRVWNHDSQSMMWDKTISSSVNRDITLDVFEYDGDTLIAYEQRVIDNATQSLQYDFPISGTRVEEEKGKIYVEDGNKVKECNLDDSSVSSKDFTTYENIKSMNSMVIEGSAKVVTGTYGGNVSIFEPYSTGSMSHLEMSFEDISETGTTEFTLKGTNYSWDVGQTDTFNYTDNQYLSLSSDTDGAEFTLDYTMDYPLLTDGDVAPVDMVVSIQDNSSTELLNDTVTLEYSTGTVSHFTNSTQLQNMETLVMDADETGLNYLNTTYDYVEDIDTQIHWIYNATLYPDDNQTWWRSQMESVSMTVENHALKNYSATGANYEIYGRNSTTDSFKPLNELVGDSHDQIQVNITLTGNETITGYMSSLELNFEQNQSVNFTLQDTDYTEKTIGYSNQFQYTNETELNFNSNTDNVEYNVSWETKYPLLEGDEVSELTVEIEMYDNESSEVLGVKKVGVTNGSTSSIVYKNIKWENFTHLRVRFNDTSNLNESETYLDFSGGTITTTIYWSEEYSDATSKSLDMLSSLTFWALFMCFVFGVAVGVGGRSPDAGAVTFIFALTIFGYAGWVHWLIVFLTILSFAIYLSFKVKGMNANDNMRGGE